MLRAGSHSFDQLDASSHRVVASYYYKDITAIYEASDYPGGFVLQVRFLLLNQKPPWFWPVIKSLDVINANLIITKSSDSQPVCREKVSGVPRYKKLRNSDLEGLGDFVGRP